MCTNPELQYSSHLTRNCGGMKVRGRCMHDDGIILLKNCSPPILFRCFSRVVHVTAEEFNYLDLFIFLKPFVKIPVVALSCCDCFSYWDPLQTMAAAKIPLPFRVIQSFIIVGGGTYLSTQLFPKDIENVLFDIADHIVLPIMHKMDAEDAHKLSIFIAKNLPLLCPQVSVICAMSSESHQLLPWSNLFHVSCCTSM